MKQRIEHVTDHKFENFTDREIIEEAQDRNLEEEILDDYRGTQSHPSDFSTGELIEALEYRHDLVSNLREINRLRRLGKAYEHLLDQLISDILGVIIV